MRYVRRFSQLSSLLLVLSLFLFAGQVEASDGLVGFSECVVEADEIIADDFYFACQTLEIHGYIDGDVVGIASEVLIAREAQVVGDVWVGGGQLVIEGIVGDDVHFVGVDLDVTGLARFPNPKTDIVGGGLSVEIAQDTIIPGNVVYYGYQAIIEGRINGNIDFQGQSLHILNNVAGNVDVIVGDQEGTAPLSSFPILYSVEIRDPGLYFREGANSDMEGFIYGNLTYEAPQQIRTVDNVDGDSEYIRAISETSISNIEEPSTFIQVLGNYIFVTVRDVTALSLIGILLLNYFARGIVEPGYRVQTSPIPAFSWGLVLALLSLPFSLLLILTSIIILFVVFVITINELTFIVSIFLLVLNLGVIGGFLFLFIFMGRIITSFVVGFLVLRQVQRLWLRFAGTPPTILGEIWFTIIIGVTLISLIINIPLGALFGIGQIILTGLVACAGLGALFMYLRDLYELGGDRQTLTRGDSMITVPPPPPDDAAPLNPPIGMENLPQGFTGFDDWDA